METIRWNKDQDGVVVLTIDDPEQSANTMNRRFIESLREAIDRLESERDELVGVVLTSAKKSFFAGGDLHGRAHHAEGRTDARRHHARHTARRRPPVVRPVPTAARATARTGTTRRRPQRQHPDPRRPGWRLEQVVAPPGRGRPRYRLLPTPPW